MMTGVVVGLLIAPASGRETRQKIADSSDALKKKLRYFKKKASTELDNLKEILENEVEGLKDDVREKILLLIETSREGYNDISDEDMYD